MSDIAWPIASVDDVHPVEITWDGPRNAKTIDSSLDRDPGVEEGMV
jgi:hypothetical protein